MYDVLLNWNLDNPTIQPIDKGISSDAYLITVNDNKYMLRKLSNEQQGSLEYSECRMGSVYFDIAAVITSLLSNLEDEESISKYINIFIQIYSKHNTFLNQNLLEKYFQLWYVRGILTNTLEENYQIGKTEKAINYFWKQFKKFCDAEDLFTT